LTTHGGTTPPGVRNVVVGSGVKPLDAVVTQAVRDYQLVLVAVRAGKASARREGEALAVLREVLCPGIIEPLPMPISPGATR
jgi:hypothetical protein